MRWTPGGSRDNIEDRRGSGGFGGRGVPLGIGGTIVVALLSIIFGQDFFALLGDGSGTSAPVAEDSAQRAQEEPKVEFVTFVLNDVQATWKGIFDTQGRAYRDARLVLFRDGVQSACGSAGAETGPFYCPADQKAYIDLSFFDELDRRFGAPGDFAQAYVLAHEIGHHVQNLLGIEQQVRRAQPGGRAGNAMSVRMELQADCFAGVWGYSAAKRDKLDPGDVDEGLGAAAAIGDDRLQKMSRGQVVPESFTHGSSAQRVQWFRRGLESGQMKDCDTFAAQ